MQPARGKPGHCIPRFSGRPRSAQVENMMLVTNLKTNLADPSFEPSSPAAREAAREERMAQAGLERYREGDLPARSGQLPPLLKPGGNYPHC
jgi:hypothetical protein